MYDPEALPGMQDADFEQRDMEEQGRDHARARRQSLAAMLRGDMNEATRLCPHSWQGNDDHGQLRCHECGASMEDDGLVLDTGDGVTIACIKCDGTLTIAGYVGSVTHRVAVCDRHPKHTFRLKGDRK